MNWQSVSFDWNQARAFLATAEEGSLSGAARALGLTQPTLGRQVAALENTLGVTLFDRAGRSLILTPTGLELLDHVRDMGSAAIDVSLAASGRSQAIEGQVSITATNMTATFYLPPILKRLREAAPGIEVEVIVTNEVRDLRRREADIAIRHARPEQPELIAKRVHVDFGHLYASTTYLAKFGRPKAPGDLADAEFIGFEHPAKLLPLMTSMGIPVTRDNFKISTASGTMIMAMVEEGLGFGIFPKGIAGRMKGIEQVLPELKPIEVPTWLATHRELHTSRRIRLVFDLIADGFRRVHHS